MESIVLKSYRELSFLKIVREGIKEGGDDGGEGKFGLVPPSADPNSVLSQATVQASKKRGEGPRLHPLLSKSPQFSGVDRYLSADPVSNEEAQEKYQLQLQRQLQHRYRQRKTPPRLMR